MSAREKKSSGNWLAVGTAVVLVLVMLGGFFVVRFLQRQSEASEAMEQICALVEVGSSADEVRELADSRADLQLLDNDVGVQLSRTDGEFFCLCDVELADGAVSSVGGVFCID